MGQRRNAAAKWDNNYDMEAKWDNNCEMATKAHGTTTSMDNMASMVQHGKHGQHGMETWQAWIAVASMVLQAHETCCMTTWFNNDTWDNSRCSNMMCVAWS